MITRLQKQTQIQILSESIKKSQAAFLLQFKGLNVQDITKLRKELRTNNLANMKVCRNTLIKKSLETFPEIKKHLSPYLVESNAMVFANKDVSVVAKILFNYEKLSEGLQIKTGILDKKPISIEEIKILATLPSLEVLKAKFLGVLAAPMSDLLAVFSAAPQGFLRVLSSQKDKKKNEKTSKKIEEKTEE